MRENPATPEALVKDLACPLRVGNRTIDSRLVLAPMAMLGHVAHRELVTRFGAPGLLFSEMCSARLLPRENRHISPCFRWRDEESSRLVCQIFGADPEQMAAAARRIAQEGFFGVDINFGCAAGDICRLNGGAAVLRNPDLAEKIVTAVRNTVPIPVFVKYRTGWQDNPEFAVTMARRFEAAGADALTFHPRVAPDRRAHRPKWDYIRQVKAAVSIPVFGNGDVFTEADALRMMAQTRCDGIAVGRMAVARPWIFAQWLGKLQPTRQIYRNTALAMAEALSTHYDSAGALRRYKKFAMYFASNFKFGHTFHSSIQGAKHMDAVRERIDRFFRTDPELVTHHNINFLR